MSRKSLIHISLLALCATAVLAETVRADHHRGRWHRSDQYVETREIPLSADLARIRVNASPNGGISVEGWDKNEILLVARIGARADSAEEEKEIAAKVEIRTDRIIEAVGPRLRHDDESWWVSFELRVPNGRDMDLDLETKNGGIQIEDVRGRIRFDALNGGVSLAHLAGDVGGRTTNGGVKVELSGTRWEGRALDVETTNGGIELWIPEDYNAKVETGTVNGRLRTDFPVTVQGEIDRELRLTLGEGGALVRATTVNGSARIRRQ